MHQNSENLHPDDVLRSLWLAGELSFKLHEAQLVIAQGIASLPPHVKEAVLLCCRRFGKSYFGTVHGLEAGLRTQRRKIIRIIGPTIKQTKMIVEYNMAKITEELQRLDLKYLVEHVKYENMYKIGDHAALFLGGFDSQADSLRGGEADLILIEESGSADPDQYTYQMRSVIKPQLLKTRGRMIHLTTLPPLPDHPFITETIPEAQLDNAFYSYTIYEDPLATEQIIEDAIKDCGGEETDTFKREYLNVIIRDRSIVAIPDFDINQDVELFELPYAVNLELFIDWGGTRDFTVALLLGYDFLRAIDLCVDELWWPHNTATEIIVADLKRKFLSQYTPKNIYADVPGQLQLDLRETHKLDVKLPHKTDWEANLNNLAVRFAKRKMRIHPRCKLTIQTCQSGTLNKQRTDFARTTALGHMDALATLMYGNRTLDRSNPFPESQSDNLWHFKKTTTEKTGQNILPSQSFTPKGIKVFK
jgi:hypothetical protein